MSMTRIARLWIAGLAAGALAIAGCGQGKPADSTLKPSETGAPLQERVVSSRPEGRTSRKVDSSVELSVVKYDQLQAAIQAQRGHVVVMDIWAEY